MTWNPEQLVRDFLTVAELAGTKLQPDAVRVEALLMPHKPPSNLPVGNMAVYVFLDGDRVLKVGRVGSNSGARYTSQHYNPRSSGSNLAKSLLGDKAAVQRYDLNYGNVSAWIKKNTDRVNLIVDSSLGMGLLTLLEAFVQCRLPPVYEGSQNQRSSGP